MARYTGPRHKLCRREGTAICGLPNCPVTKKNAGPPGQHGQKRFRKMSEYGTQLREKQKVKRMYQILEKQFKKYYLIASAKKQATGLALLQLLEKRLDNVVYRLNLTVNRAQARQLVSHGHIQVNARKVTISSFDVKIGDIISVSTKAAGFSFIKKLEEETKNSKLPSWLEKKGTVGKVCDLPKREDLNANINENLIVEFYSR